jgi:hypothetical protein
MGNYFLTRTPPAQEIGSTIGKWDCIKLNFLHIKRNDYQDQETTHKME